MGAIHVSVVPFSSPTANGSADVVGDLDGESPKLFLSFLSRYIPSGASGGICAHAEIGMGAADGTRQWSAAEIYVDAVATTSGAYRSSTTLCAMSIGGGAAVEVGAAFTSFAADKATINWTTTQPGGAYDFIGILIGGDEFQCRVDQLTATTGGAATTAPGFNVKGLLTCTLTAGTSSVFPQSGTTGDQCISFGAAANDGANGVAAQGGQLWRLDDNQNNHSTTLQLSNTILAYTFDVSRTFSITAFSSTGFTATSTGGDLTFAYVAMDFGTIPYALDFFDTKDTSTGTKTYDVGFPWLASIMGVSNCTALDSAGTNGGGGGLGAVTNAGEQGAASYQGDNDSDPTDTECSVSGSAALLGGISGGSPLSITAAFDSFTGDTFTLNFTSIPADTLARKFYCFSIGTDEAVAPIEGNLSETLGDVTLDATANVNDPGRVTQQFVESVIEIERPSARAAQQFVEEIGSLDEFAARVGQQYIEVVTTLRNQQVIQPGPRKTLVH